ncbi:MAG TPA: DUF2892 domain-containing protein [Symbiobacteriaceae bacterium]|jgi:hypothetical protein
MKVNVGTADKLVRVVIALVAGYLGYVTGGVWAWVGYAVAAIMLVTAAVGFCPLYTLFGLNTCPVKKQA